MDVDASVLVRTEEDRLAFEWVESVIPEHSKTFYYATQLLPSIKRHGIRALYAFCRKTDDLVDKEGAMLADVSAWRLQVRSPLSGQDGPMLRTWKLARETFGVDTRYEDELIDGVAKDVDFHPYETWEALAEYCYLVASTVGMLSLPIIGLNSNYTLEQAQPYAIKLGVALQLTNILRDIGEDLDRGRVYFPKEDLQQFGLTLADIQQQTYDERFVSLMKFEIARAHQLYEESFPGIAMLHCGSRLAVVTATLLYRAILDEIEAMNYKVYEQRAFTTSFKKVSMIPQIVWQEMRLRAPVRSL